MITCGERRICEEVATVLACAGMIIQGVFSTYFAASVACCAKLKASTIAAFATLRFKRFRQCICHHWDHC